MTPSGATRRSFLTMAVGGIATASLTSLSSAHAAPEQIAITPITDSIAQVTGAGSNVVLFTSPAGVAMIDGGLAEHSEALLQTLAQYTKVSHPQILFNSHWHWDHTGSNERLGKAGTRIVAHENTKLWLGADFFVDWENRAYLPRPKIAWPTETFRTRGQVSLGAEEIHYQYLPRAHTDGDICVFFPAQNVLVAGDVVAVGSYPVLDSATGGWIVGLTEATQALIDLSNAQTRIVPGNGPVQTRADLQAQHHMLSTMSDRLMTLMKQGMGTDDVLAAKPTAEFDARWGDPRLFLTNAMRSLWGHVREIPGII